MVQKRITRSDVFTAADKLAESKQSITLESIRRTLGSGSMSTIAPHLREWRQLAEPHYRAKASNLPPALLEQLENLWTSLKEDASNQLKRAQQTHEEAYDQLCAHNVKLQAELEQALAEHTHLRGKLRQQDKVQAELQTKHDKLVINKASLTTQFDQAKTRLNDKESEIARTHDHQRALEKKLSELHAHSSEQLQQRELAFSAERSRWHDEQRELIQALHQKDKEHQQVLQASQAETRAHQESKEQNKSLLQQLQQFEHKANQSAHSLTKLETTLELLTQSKNQFETTNQHLQKQVNTLQTKLAQTIDQLIESQAQTHQLNHDLSQLRQQATQQEEAMSV